MAGKAFVRAGLDRSQRIRWAFQAAFLLLNIWIGVEFYLFVRHFETAGATVYVDRPPGVEGWLPIAALMNLKVWLATGELPSLHPAGVVLLVAFLAISFLWRKAFCSWLCPVGTVSEWLWRTGRQTFRRNFQLPRWADISLRSLKYALLGLFLYAVGSMSVVEIRAFLDGPYGVIADVKMLNFFRFLGVTAAVVLGLLLILSIFVQNFWCRYLCPYGAMVGLVSLLSPARIRRSPEACIDCAKCAQACPALLPVDKLITVRSAECTGCLECVAVCPAAGALWMSAGKRRRIPAWAMAAGIAVLFLGVVGYARWTGHWTTEIPARVYGELIPRAHEFSHP
ncbi:MAG: 4Fe-4S binding protein [Bryobacterales bacterium]|nr:4Fe-4S binding protein [Bryobacterales bacterium]